MTIEAITEGPILRPVVKLSAALSLGALLNMVTMLVDRVFVGEVGTVSMAALGTALAALMVLVTFAIGLAMGTLATVARNVGAGRLDLASRSLVNGLYLSAAFGAFFAACSVFLPEHLLAAMDTPESLAGEATGYLRISMAGLVLHAPMMAVAFGLQGAGRARDALMLSAASAALTVLLDPLFIFTFGLGAAGAAMAGVVSHGAGLALAVRIVVKGPLRPKKEDWRPDAALIRRIAVVGLPSSFEQVVRTVAGAALVKFISPFGAEVVSAYTCGVGVLMVLITPGIAIGQATAALVGQNLGAGKNHRAWRTAWYACGLYAGLMVVAATIVYAFAPTFIALFDDNAAVIAEGERMLRWGVLCFPLLAVAMVLSRAFAGAGQTVPALLVAAIAHLCVQLPAVAFLIGRMGPQGAYLGMTIAFCVHGTLAAVWFHRRFHHWRVPA